MSRGLIGAVCCSRPGLVLVEALERHALRGAGLVRDEQVDRPGAEAVGEIAIARVLIDPLMRIFDAGRGLLT